MLPDLDPLTPAQARVRDALQKRLQADPNPPTLQELADDLKVTIGTIFFHVQKLIEKGWLTKQRNQRHSLKFTDAANETFR